MTHIQVQNWREKKSQLCPLMCLIFLMHVATTQCLNYTGQES